MIKHLLIGGSANETIVERPKGTTQIAVDGDDNDNDNDNEEEIYAVDILPFQDKGYCAFAILIGHRYCKVELEILAEKYSLPVYSIEEVTLP